MLYSQKSQGQKSGGQLGGLFQIQKQSLSEIQLKRQQLKFNDGLIPSNDGFSYQSNSDTNRDSKIQRIMIFEDAKSQKYLYQKFEVIDQCIGLISTIGLFLAIVAYDIEYNDTLTSDQQTQLTIILYTIFVQTIILLFMIVYRYVVILEFLIVSKQIQSDCKLFHSELFKYICIDIFLAILIPLKWLQGYKLESYNYYFQTNVTYNYNDFLYIFINLRFIFIFRVLLNPHIYCNSRAKRITRMYGCNSNYLYAIRCLIKKNPLQFTSVQFLLSILIFGIPLRMCESPVMKLQTQVTIISNYFNAFWCVIVTFTTVGFGDYYPTTLPGRLIDFVVCIWGIFGVSLIVVSLSSLLKLKNLEVKALSLIQKLEVRHKCQNVGSKIMHNAMKYSSLVLNAAKNQPSPLNKNKKYQNNQKGKDNFKKDKLSTLQALSKLQGKFRKHIRELKGIDDGLTENERIQNAFQQLTFQLELTQKQAYIQKVISKEIANKIGVAEGANFKFTQQEEQVFAKDDTMQALYQSLISSK